MTRTRALLFVLWWLLTFPALAFEEAVERDVPYVPTPENVVAEMLRLADVGQGDLVYDLGCGDGRIVITAARERGARGIGVDIDPQRIRESEALARQAQVTDRVKFVQQDLFEIDMREADVVTLYLLPSVNLRLRPKLLAELRPGTRVVSHDFDMEEWKPDRVAKMKGHAVYFWLVPANATGSWEWARSGPNGEARSRLDLQQSFQVITGTLTEGAVQLPIREGRVTGDQLRFTVEHRENGRAVAVAYEGWIRGDRLQGIRRVAGAREQTWGARRDPSTRVPLEEP